MTSDAERLQRRLAREQAARREAEDIAEKALRGLHLRNAELTTRNADLEEFASVVAHDLRSPLAVAAGFLELIQTELAGTLSDQLADMLTRVRSNHAHMDQLIGDLLEYARTGYEELSIGDVDTQQIVTSVIDRLPEHPCVETDRLPTVAADARLLEQIFHNLIGNAVKHAEVDDDPYVAARAQRSGDEWEFVVADNGGGIPDDALEGIFEPLVRLKPHLVKGTGLGLSICRRAVARHGGRIWAHRNDIGGTDFRFTIPA